jgi:RNA polymerase sigma factor (sigma-70 family)
VEDAQQDIKLKMLESLKKFDPRKEVRLNTYVQMVLECKLKNQMRDENTNGNNATFLNINLRRYSCKCGNNFEHIEDNDKKTICSNCQSSDGLRQIKIAHREIWLDDLGWRGVVNNHAHNPENSWILKHDFENYLENSDLETKEFLDLIFFKDLSLSETAEKLDISKQTVYDRLKKIQNDKMVKEWGL